ncbi:uncharacterized protein [Typha angustifolia]|uniref:uncharacterized protein isoform X1 n=1 Tax=Typha angustifolia TaxID=59011 RepID=UPI003C2DEC62
MDRNVLFVVGREEEKSREYRKGNWSLNETMVLIEAKKMDSERRMKRVNESESKIVGGSSISSSSSSNKPPEMRWKWVEDYCWRNGCNRSQNQCNDRWDNLMRDYKKVRAYELRVEDHGPSYWKLERHERKERNLPSNLLPEIYVALTEVVDKREGVEGTSGDLSNLAGSVAEERQMGRSVSASRPPPLPHPTPKSTALAQMCDSSDSDDNDHCKSPERKRRRGEEGCSRSKETRGLRSSISKCASILAEAIQEGETKEENRHRDLLSIEERKAKLEESKSDISMQSMAGLATAINKLASSILGLASDKGPAPPK